MCSCGRAESNKQIDHNINSESESSDTNAEENEIILTDRQRQILQEMGLPEDYESLTDSQKSAITIIERALTYLEDSYGEEFVYDGYVAGGLDGQYLSAYAKGDLERKTITVDIDYKDGEYHYTDDYQLLKASDEYEEELEQHLRTLMAQDGECWVHAELNCLDDSDEYIIKRASGGVLVFVLNTFENYDEAKEFVEQYGDWIKSLESDYQVGASFYILDAENYSNTNAFNYQDAIHSEKYIYHLRCSVSREGKITIYEQEE